MGATQSTEQTVVYSTTKGKLRGIQKTDSITGKPVYHRFSSIPYALPPTGARRWRRPERLPSDFSFNAPSGDAGDYTQFSPVCPQPIYAHGAVEVPNSAAAPEPITVFSEDCLYLNIWVPASDPPPNGWPVQFYIHGGWLQMGDANHSNKHDPFYLIQEFPRIIVAPAYRLNLFGFLSCSELETEDPSRAPGNYGFWDQRTALEWTYDNVTQFGGNPDNISVGGLSAGAYSTIFQLNYDVRRPNPAERLIKQVYLFSNAVGVQPNPVISSDTKSQFDELLSVLEISQLLSPQEKMDTLRNIPASSLIDAIGRLNQHTFRAGTDGDFIHSDFLSDIHSGIFGGILANRGIDAFLGEVADEATLYRLVNPASSYESLVVQLNNYYPKRVTEELLKVYPLPSADAGKEEWADVGARIIGDCQVHATIRGFTAALLLKMPQERVYRYRISWRAKALDNWLEPSVRLCHASDIPIWWSCGRRAGFEQSDLEIVTEWLRPFHHFLNGEKVQHNITKMDQVIELTKEGKVETVQDPLWEWGLQVWEAMRRSQLD